MIASPVPGPVGHLNSVCNSPELRTAYEARLPAVGLLHGTRAEPRAVRSLPGACLRPAAAGFEVAQKTILEHSLRDFRLSGIDLPPVEQQRFGAIQMKLAELGSKFSNQLLDATQELDPAHHRREPAGRHHRLGQGADGRGGQTKGLDGWLITSNSPATTR